MASHMHHFSYSNEWLVFPEAWAGAWGSVSLLELSADVAALVLEEGSVFVSEL